MVKEEKVYWQLFKNIFIISACTFGGGFVIVGMIKGEICRKTALDIRRGDFRYGGQSHSRRRDRWELIWLSLRLPHPEGSGAFVCALGAVLPPLIIISVISVFYQQFRDNPVIALALQVMRSGVAAVIFT